jgi:hypothetical protein
MIIDVFCFAEGVRLVTTKKPQAATCGGFGG